MAFVYILECCDGSFYTGSTRDLKKRLEEHYMGEGAQYTARKQPVHLVYYEEFERIDEAFNREKQIQGWRRDKKQALVDAHYEKLVELSRNYTEYPPVSRLVRQAHQPDGGQQGVVRQAHQPDGAQESAGSTSSPTGWGSPTD